MEKISQLLKIILLLIVIIIGIGVVVLMYLFITGDKNTSLGDTVKKTAIESVIDDEKMTPTQKEMLESGDIEGLVEDLKENVTQEQVDCAVNAVGESRAKELFVTNDPSPAEMLKLSKCL